MVIDFKKQKGTAGFDGKPKRFKDLGEFNIEVFVNENLQNILDNRLDKNKPAKVRYVIKTMTEELINNFYQILDSESRKMIIKSYEMSESIDVKTFMKKVVQYLDSELDPISLWIYEENTTGLIGNENPKHNESSPFNALMRELNKSDKKDTGSGGTWGKGSASYTYCSGYWVWFAYTTLSNPWKPENGDPHKKRFMGRGLIAPFKDEEYSYNGEYFLSRAEDGLPFINEKADGLAEKLFIEYRPEDEYGTSYFIPGFHPEGLESTDVKSLVNEFLHIILKKWFFPIFYKDLEVTISDESGNTVVIDKEYLFSIPELKYILSLLEWNDKGCPEQRNYYRREIKVNAPRLRKEYIDDKKKFASKESKNINNTILACEIDTDDEFRDNWFITNKVALLRGNGMVVDFREDQILKQIESETVVQVLYLAGKLSDHSDQEEKDHMELFLAYSENPAHTLWDTSGKQEVSHLNRFELNPTPYPWNRINTMFNEIGNELKSLFYKDEPKTSTKGISSIWKKLAKLSYSGATSGATRTFHVTTIDKMLPDKQGNYYWKLKINSNTDKDLTIRCIPYLESNEEMIKKAEDLEMLGIPEFLDLEIKQDGVQVDNIILNQGESVEVEICTCNISANPIFKNYIPRIRLNG